MTQSSNPEKESDTPQTKGNELQLVPEKAFSDGEATSTSLTISSIIDKYTLPDIDMIIRNVLKTLPSPPDDIDAIQGQLQQAIRPLLEELSDAVARRIEMHSEFIREEIEHRARLQADEAIHRQLMAEEEARRRAQFQIEEIRSHSALQLQQMEIHAKSSNRQSWIQTVLFYILGVITPSIVNWIISLFHK